MALAIAEWDHELITAPGVSSSATTSRPYSSSATYFAIITQYRTDTTQPADLSLSGLAVTSWVDISGVNENWDIDGASRRRTSVFVGTPASSGTGALTVSYASAPADIDINVIECSGATAGGDAAVQVSDFTGTVAGGALAEPITLSALGSTNNRMIVAVAANINNASARLELAADSGGDADWTTFTVTNSGSSPTGTYLAGTTSSTDDLTPGWLNVGATTASYYMVAIEVEQASVLTATSSYVGILGRGSSIVDPPDPTYRLLVGAACAIRSPATTYPASTEDFEQLCGIPVGAMPIGRRYYSSMATSFSGIAQFAQDINTRHRVISVKSTTATTQGAWENFMSTIPNDGYKTWVACNHEPEDNLSTTDFKATQATMRAAWVALGRPSYIQLYFCLIGYFDRDNDQTNNTPQWYPDVAIRDDFHFWPDTYDPNGQVTMEEIAGPCLENWLANGGDGSRFGIAEIGSHRPDAECAAWMQTGCTWLRSIGAAGITWFNSPVGTNAPWWVDDDRDFPNRTLTPARWGVEMLT